MNEQTFNLKQARLYAGMTQDEMADALKIHRSTYRRLERDISRATVAQVQTVSRVTGVPLASLFLAADSIK